MKLFFETTLQAQVFLALLPLGMLLAACADIASMAHKTRPIWDVLILLACGLAAVIFVEMLKDDGVRAYHLLSICTGAVIYLCGFGRLFRCAKRSIQRWLATRSQTAEKQK